MKRFTTIASTIMLAFSVAGVAQAQETLALSVSTLDNPFFVSLKDGAQKRMN